MNQLDYAIEEFVERVPGVGHAMVVSTDGLAMAASKEVSRVQTEHLAAVAAGLFSLTRGAARCFNAEPVRQVIVEMGAGYLFVTATSQSACLAVVTGLEADLGEVGYEMSILGKRLAGILTPALRNESQAALLQR